MNKLKLFLLLLTGSLITIYPALTNGYPLIYFDSNTYLNLGMSLTPNKTNPLGYGIFIRLFSWKATLWPVIFVQSLLLNITVYYVLKDFFKQYKLVFVYLFIISILSLFSGFSWFSSMLMADIFVPIMILATYLFMKNSNSTKMLIIWGFIILFTASTHYSISMILALYAVLFTIMTIKRRKKTELYKLQLYKSIFLIIPFLLLFISKSHILSSKNNKSNSVTHVFIMARLMEIGILEDYLEKNCDKHNYELCNYIDQFPNTPSEFVWNKKSPFYKTGGWKNSRKEYNMIISDIFKSPYYLGMLTYKSIISGIRQIFYYKIEIIKINKNSTIYSTIKKNMKHELKRFQVTKQFQNKIDLSQRNFIHNILIIISFSFIIFILLHRKNKFYDLSLILFSGVIFNAFVSGAVSNVSSRYQARVIWILIFIVLVILFSKLFENSKFAKMIDD